MDPGAPAERPQPSRSPPVCAPKQRHQSGDEQRADDCRIDDHGQRGADAKLLERGDVRRGERAHRSAEEQRRGADDTPAALQAGGDRNFVGRTGVVGLLDARQQEHAVVGRQPEGNDEEDDHVGLLERARGRVAEQALEAAVLEDEHQDAERGAERQ